MAGAYKYRPQYTQNTIGPPAGPSIKEPERMPVSQARVWITRTNYLALQNTAQAMNMTVEELLDDIIAQRLLASETK